MIMANSLGFTFILNGTLSLGFVILSFFVGLKIAAKYYSIKKKEFLLVGFSWIGLSEPWWPSAFSFLLVIFTGKGLSFEIYVILGNVGIPFFFSLYLIAFTELLYPKKTKIILLLIIIYGIIFEIIFFYLLFTNPIAIGVLNDPIDIEYKYFIMIFLLSMVVIIFITFLVFAHHSLKSESSEIRLKGRFLQLSIILWSFGAVLDSTVPLTLITLLITRICLFLSAIGWYIGFLLPSWAKKLFLRSRTID